MAEMLIKLGHEATICVAQTNDNLKLREYYEGIEIIRMPYYSLRGISFLFDPLKFLWKSKHFFNTLFQQRSFDQIWGRNSIFMLAALMAKSNFRYVYIPPRAISPFREEILKRRYFFNKNIRELGVQLGLKLVMIPIEREIEKKCLEKSNQIITFSKNVLKEIEMNYKASQELSIKVLQPGVDFERFNKKSAKYRDELKQKLCINSKDKIVLYVGRLTPEKNVQMLMKSMCFLANDIRLVLVGDGIVKQKMIKMIENKNLADRVVFAGISSSPEDFYNIADIFVLPSLKEGFGFVLLEALSCALPIIGFKNNPPQVMVANDEIICDGKTGFLVSEPSAESLATYITRFFALSNRKRRAMGQIARKDVKKRFSWEHFIKEILD